MKGASRREGTPGDHGGLSGVTSFHLRPLPGRFPGQSAGVGH